MGVGDNLEGKINREDGAFARLARQIVSSLSAVNEFGFCFRVDTRLRPFGESGPLVCSFGTMEQYYQREGRDWERYALIKARPVAGNLASGSRIKAAVGTSASFTTAWVRPWATLAMAS